MRILLALGLLAASPARAEVAVHVAPMTAASDDICELLRAERNDRCQRVVHQGDATVYQSGSPELRRFVLAIDRTGEDGVVIGTSVDIHADDDATLVAAHPTVRAVRIDGQPALLLDVTATFRAHRERWQVESVVGCGQTAEGAWRCGALDAGRCTPTVDDDGNVVTSCGERVRLTLGPS